MFLSRSDIMTDRQRSMLLLYVDPNEAGFNLRTETPFDVYFTS